MEEIEIEEVGSDEGPGLGNESSDKIESMLQVVTNLLRQSLKASAETRVRLEKLEEATMYNNKRLESLDSRIYFLTKSLPSHHAQTHHASNNNSHGPVIASHPASHGASAANATTIPTPLHPATENPSLPAVKPSLHAIRSAVAPSLPPTTVLVSSPISTSIAQSGLPIVTNRKPKSFANASNNSDSVLPLVELSPSEPKTILHPSLPAISPALGVEENERELERKEKEKTIEQLQKESEQEKDTTIIAVEVEEFVEYEKERDVGVMEIEESQTAIGIEQPVLESGREKERGESIEDEVVEKPLREVEPEAVRLGASESMETEVHCDPQSKESAIVDNDDTVESSPPVSPAKELVHVASNLVDIDLLPENKRKGDSNSPIDERHTKKSKSLDGTPIAPSVPSTTALQQQNPPHQILVIDSDDEDLSMPVEEPKLPTATPPAKTPARLSQDLDEEATQSFEEESPTKLSSNAKSQRASKLNSNASPIVIPDSKPRIVQYKPDASTSQHARERDGINLKKIYRGTIRSPVSYAKHVHKREGLLGQLILIWWPQEQACFIGQIRRWYEGTDDFIVHYFVDKKNVNHTLSQEQWCFVYDPD